jgi:hypothetical protein
MIDISAIDINFQILSHSNDAILVKPFSKLFKKPLDSYQSFNLDMTNIDPNGDINLQIAHQVSGYIINTVRSEELSQNKDFNQWLNDNLNQTVSVSHTSLFPPVTAEMPPSDMTTNNISLESGKNVEMTDKVKINFVTE